MPPTGETEQHRRLKALALAWARAQGMTLAALEVSFPHRRFRVDVAACAPTRNVPSRQPSPSVSSVLRAATVFECKQARSDLVRDNKRREATSQYLKTWEARRTRLETLLHLHLPQLANGESLFPEFDSYRLREHRHEGYQKLIRKISVARKALLEGTKFDRLFSYRVANLHYLVVQDRLLEPHEVPTGWGLLTCCGDRLELRHKPTWQEIGVEHEVIFLQRIASRAAYPGPRTTKHWPALPSRAAWSQTASQALTPSEVRAE